MHSYINVACLSSQGNDLWNTEYPAWSESIWASGIPAVRVFLIPDKGYEVRLVNNALIRFLLEQ